MNKGFAEASKDWKKKREPDWRDAVAFVVALCVAIFMVGWLLVLFGWVVDPSWSLW